MLSDYLAPDHFDRPYGTPSARLLMMVSLDIDVACPRLVVLRPRTPQRAAQHNGLALARLTAARRLPKFQLPAVADGDVLAVANMMF
jgi:hypothetical protein